ncbi:hypothetical protein Lesp01_81700 [Lentzea sp. NBRC 102530]|nr:hypothetical protein Lesp01_81700 [Lentzea sp. NBRC 102530]
MSGLRAGDLKFDVLNNMYDKPVAVFVRSEGDQDDYEETRDWAEDVTATSLRTYDRTDETGTHEESTPWPASVMPLFVIFKSGPSRAHGLRHGRTDESGQEDTRPVSVTAEQLAKVLRADPRMRQLLPADGNRPLVVVSPGWSPADGRTFTDVFSQGGFRRNVHLLASGQLTGPGWFEVDGPRLETFTPPPPRPDDIVSYPSVNGKLGTYGQFFPNDVDDVLGMSAEARRDRAVRHLYYLKEISPATKDENGGEVPARYAPYLTPFAMSDKAVWIQSGHGDVGGLEFRTKTDSPLHFGDSVTLRGGDAARIMYGTSAYMGARSDPERPIMLVFCMADAVSASKNESDAKALGKEWNKAVSAKAVTYAAETVIVTAPGKPVVVTAGGSLADADRSPGDGGGSVPLSDLAADRIDPLEVELSWRGNELLARDAERVRQIARKVARAAAWRQRNEADLPEVTISTEPVAAVFRAELAAELTRLGRLGRAVSPTDITITVAGRPHQKRFARISVVLPGHALGADAVAGITGHLDGIANAEVDALETAFAKLVNDAPQPRTETVGADPVADALPSPSTTDAAPSPSATGDAPDARLDEPDAASTEDVRPLIHRDGLPELPWTDEVDRAQRYLLRLTPAQRWTLLDKVSQGFVVSNAAFRAVLARELGVKGNNVALARARRLATRFGEDQVRIRPGGLKETDAWLAHSTSSQRAHSGSESDPGVLLLDSPEGTIVESSEDESSDVASGGGSPVFAVLPDVFPPAGIVASGALSYDSGLGTDKAFWERVYATLEEATELTRIGPPPFYVFVTWAGNKIMVDGKLVDGTQLAEAMRRSPHFQAYAADRSVPIRLVGRTYRDKLRSIPSEHKLAMQFLQADRGPTDAFRYAELAVQQVEADSNGDIVPVPDSGYLPVPVIEPDDVQWTAFTGPTGENFGLAFDVEPLSTIARRLKPVESDLALRLIYEEVPHSTRVRLTQQAWVPETFGSRVRPVLVALSSRDGVFMVPLPGGHATAATPLRMAELLLGSTAFKPYRSLITRPRLLLLSDDPGDGGQGRTMADFADALQRLNGEPWQTHEFAGRLAYGTTGLILPPNAVVNAGPPLSIRSVFTIITPSVFGFPADSGASARIADLADEVDSGTSTLDGPWTSVRRTRGKKPLFVVVDSPDGTYARVMSRAGRKYDVSGADLASMLLRVRDFAEALDDDPDVPVVLLARDAGRSVPGGSLGYQFAGELRGRVGFFGDVYAPIGDPDAPEDRSDVEFARVSNLRGTDLEVDVLLGAAGESLGLYFFGDGSNADMPYVTAWAREVTPASLAQHRVELPHGDLTALKPSGWPAWTLPILVFVTEDQGKIPVIRKDGMAVRLSPDRFAKMLATQPQFRRMLAYSPHRPILLVSTTGGTTVGKAIVEALLDGGVARKLFEAPHGLSLDAGGELTVRGRRFAVHRPPAPRADQIMWYPRQDSWQSGSGHIAPTDPSDPWLMPLSASIDKQVRQQYYLRRVASAKQDAQGQVIEYAWVIPYLSPNASGDLPAYVWDGHGTETGFVLGLATGNPMEVGDSVVVGGKEAAKLLNASGFYQMAGLDPQMPVLLSVCVADSVSPGREGSAAALFSRHWRLVHGGKPEVVGTHRDVYVSPNSSVRSVKASTFRAVGQLGNSLDDGIPLWDLAAANIDSVDTKFDATGVLGKLGTMLLHSLARKVARAAAWRALNGAGMPKLVVNGYTDDLGESPSESAYAAIRSEMVAEWGRLGRLARGLGVDDVAVDLVDLLIPPGARRHATVSVELPVHELGLAAIAEVQGRTKDSETPETIEKLDRAFAKLALPPAQPAWQGGTPHRTQPMARARITETPAAVHEPSAHASGGLSFDLGGYVDLDDEARTTRYAAVPPAPADEKPFYLYLTPGSGGLYANGSWVSPRVLLEILKNSPHYRQHAAGSPVPVRIVGADPRHREVRQFAALLRSKDGFRLVEASKYQEDGFQRVAEIQPDDVAWLPLYRADGSLLGASFDTEARQASGTVLNASQGTDESVRLVLEEHTEAGGLTDVRPKIALWADTTDGARLRPFELLLDADGEEFVVPLRGDGTVRVSPEEMAKLAYKSELFAKFQQGNGQPDVLLITNDPAADHASTSEANRRFQARLRELGGPRRITAYAGPADHDATVSSLRVPQGAKFEQTFSSRKNDKFSLNAAAVRKSVSPAIVTSTGSVFAFPLPGHEMPGLRNLTSAVREGRFEPDAMTGRRPLYVMADSPDGRHFRVSLHGGRELELSGADFGRMVLTHPVVRRELAADPDRPVVLVTTHSVTTPHFGDAAHDFAAALQEAGIYRDVYSWASPESRGDQDEEFALVSGLRDGDLDVEVLDNGDGHPVALYVRADNDDADYQAAKEWALHATDEKLRAYQVEAADGSRDVRDADWTEMPLFLIAGSGAGGFRGKRRDGVTVPLTSEQLAKVLSGNPRLREILGTDGAGRSIVLASPDGGVTDGDKVRDSLLEGGFRRTLRTATAGLTFKPDGTITVRESALAIHEASNQSELTAADIVTHPRVTLLRAVDGQYFPSSPVDTYLMSRTARSMSSRRRYYVREEVTEASRKNGPSETEYVAYLSPIAGGGKPYVIDSHGTPEGFVVGLPTSRKWEIGDTVVIGGATMSRLVSTGAAYQRAGTREEHSVLLLACSVNQSGAVRDLDAGLRSARKTPSRIVGFTSGLRVHSGNGLLVADQDGGPALAGTEGALPPLPLADLAADAINPVTVSFPARSKTLLADQRDQVADTARRVARAAVWYAANGAGPIRVKITGFGTIGTVSRGARAGLDRANATNDLFMARVRAEFAVLRKYGLDTDPAHLKIDVIGDAVPRGGARVATIEVTLPSVDVGQRALRNLAVTKSNDAVAEVDTAFAKLTPDARDHGGGGSGWGGLVRRGRQGFVDTFGSSPSKAGGLGYNWTNDSTARWTHLEGSIPGGADRPFDIFALQNGDAFQIADRMVDAASFAAIVASSPHFAANASDARTRVRLFGLDLNDAVRAGQLAQRFGEALRGHGPFRLVEAALFSLEIGQDGQARALSGSRIARATSPRVDDVSWIPMTDVDGQMFGMAFDSELRRKQNLAQASRRLTADLQTRVMKEIGDGAGQRRALNQVWVPSADGARSRVALLLLTGDGTTFDVPLNTGITLRVPAAETAKLILGSSHFSAFTSGGVLPTLLLVTSTMGVDPPGANPTAQQLAVAKQKMAMAKRTNADLLAAMRALSRSPWQSFDYAGRAGIVEGTLAVRWNAEFTPAPLPPVADIAHLFLGNVFGFPGADVTPRAVQAFAQSVARLRTSALGRTSGSTTLYIVVDSSDGRFARLRGRSGALIEVDGTRLGEMLLTVPEFRQAMKDDPERPWRVVGRRAGELAGPGGLAFDLAGALRKEGFFGQGLATTGEPAPLLGGAVTLADVDVEDVSTIRHGDLALSVLPAGPGGVQGMYIWSSGNRGGYDKAALWTSKATLDTLAEYQIVGPDGRARTRRSSLTMPPLVVFVDSGPDGYHALRHGGKSAPQNTKPLFVSPAELAAMMSGLSMLTRSRGLANRQPILLISPNGVLGIGDRLAQALMASGHRLSVFEAAPADGWQADGRLRLTDQGLIEHPLPTPGPADVVLHGVHRGGPSGSFVAYAPVKANDLITMHMSAHNDNAAQQMYHLKTLTTQETDAQGNQVSRTRSIAYLSPWAGDDNPPVFFMGHANATGFRFALKTDRPGELGDEVVLDGATAAKAYFASDVYRRAQLDGNRPVVLQSCRVNAIQPAGDTFAARVRAEARQARLRRLINGTPRFYAANSQVRMIGLSGGRDIDAGAFFSEAGTPTPRPEDDVPLADLAASRIEPEMVFFGSDIDPSLSEGDAEKIRRLGQRIARAALWRKRNGAELPFVTVAGGSMTVADLVASALQNEMAVEWARRGRLGRGLTLGDVTIEIGSLDRTPATTVLITTLLSAEDLGESELEAIEPKFDTTRIAAVNAKFAKLAHDGQPAPGPIDSPDPDSDVEMTLVLGSDTTDSSEQGGPAGFTLVERTAELPGVVTYEPGLHVAGGVSFDSEGDGSDDIHWRVQYQSLRGDADAFHVLVRKKDGKFLVNGSLLDGTAFAGLVRRSPHFEEHAGGFTVPVRLVWEGPRHDTAAESEVVKFIEALGTPEQPRYVEFSNGVADFRTVHVPVHPKSVQWVPIIGGDGAERGMGFASGDEAKQALGGLSAHVEDESLRMIETYDAAGKRTGGKRKLAEWAPATTGGRVRPVPLVLDSEGDFLAVPLNNGMTEFLSPEEAARLVFESDLFGRLVLGQVKRPPLLLFTSRQGGSSGGAVNAKFVEALRGLAGSLHVFDYDGPLEVSKGWPVPRIPAGRVMGESVPSGVRLLVTGSGSVFGLPSSEESARRMELFGEAVASGSVSVGSVGRLRGRNPLFVVVDSVDGTFAEVLGEGGVVHEVGGGVLARLLRGNAEFESALRAEPGRPVVLVGARSGERAKFGGVGFDFAGELRLGKDFRDVFAVGAVAGASGLLGDGGGEPRFTLVSVLRAGDLKTDALLNSAGEMVAWFVRSPGDRRKFEEAKKWALNAVGDQRKKYRFTDGSGTFEMGYRGVTSELPVVIFVGLTHDKRGIRTSRQDSAEQVLSIGELAGVLRGDPKLRELLGTDKSLPIVLVSQDGMVPAIADFTEEMAKGAYLRKVHVPAQAVTPRPDGVIYMGKGQVESHVHALSFEQKSGLIFSQPSTSAQVGTYGQFFALDHQEVFERASIARKTTDMTLRIHMEVVDTGARDSAGEPILRVAPYLSPWSGAGVPPWFVNGHGSPTTSSAALKTEHPLQLGDSLKVSGRDLAMIVGASASYQLAQPHPDSWVALMQCNQNARVEDGQENVATGFGKAWKSSKIRVFGALSTVSTRQSVAVHARGLGNRFESVPQHGRSALPRVSLKDLVVDEIDTVSLSFGKSSKTIGDQGRAELRSAADQLVPVVWWRLRTGAALPEITITGQGRAKSSIFWKARRWWRREVPGQKQALAAKGELTRALNESVERYRAAGIDFDVSLIPIRLETADSVVGQAASAVVAFEVPAAELGQTALTQAPLFNSLTQEQRNYKDLWTERLFVAFEALSHSPWGEGHPPSESAAGGLSFNEGVRWDKPHWEAVYDSLPDGGVKEFVVMVTGSGNKFMVNGKLIDGTELARLAASSPMFKYHAADVSVPVRLVVVPRRGTEVESLGIKRFRTALAAGGPAREVSTQVFESDLDSATGSAGDLLSRPRWAEVVLPPRPESTTSEASGTNTGREEADGDESGGGTVSTDEGFSPVSSSTIAEVRARTAVSERMRGGDDARAVTSSETGSPRSLAGPIGYEVRDLNVNGVRVKDLTVRLHVADRDPEMEQRALTGVEEMLNDGRRLPGGEQLHVTVEFTDDQEAADATVSITTGTGDLPDQVTWPRNMSERDLARSIGRLLGMRDEDLTVDRVMLPDFPGHPTKSGWQTKER